MDSLIGVKGKDFVILAADTNNAYSVLKMKVILLVIYFYSNTMIKYGILTDKNYQLSVENILMFLSLEIIFKKILHIYNIKMVLNCLLTILLTSSDINWLKLLEKDLIMSTVFWLDFKEMNQDFTGWIIQDQQLNYIKQLMDMLNF